MPALALLVSASSLLGTARTEVVPERLGSQTGAALPRGCVADRYQFGSDTTVQSAARAVGVEPEQIVFLGCESRSFGIVTTQGRSRPYSYRIHYPVAGSAAPDSVRARYLAPVVHEIGHVLQLEASGGIQALMASLQNSSDRVELGADFVAGILFRRLMGHLDRQEFIQSLDLVGDYRSGALDSHGSPEARTAAFRLGFHYQDTGGPLKAAHRHFQQEQFGYVVRYSPQID